MGQEWSKLKSSEKIGWHELTLGLLIYEVRSAGLRQAMKTNFAAPNVQLVLAEGAEQIHLS
jgi:hypothetical protein